MKPLFEIGEEVIFQSVSFPYLNGDATIMSSPIYVGDTFICPHCGSKNNKLTSVYSSVGYFVSTLGPEVCCTPWCQSVLRKKHKPSDKSFHEIMENAKGIKL